MVAGGSPMKRKTVLLVSLAVLCAFVLAACGFGKMRTYTEGTPTDAIERGGRKTEVTVDLRDGWACEFSNSALYMYNSDKLDNASSMGLVMWMDEDIYAEDIEDGKELESYTEENGVVSYTDENGDQFRLFMVNGDVPILMQIFNGADAEDLSSRITFGNTE